MRSEFIVGAKNQQKSGNSFLIGPNLTTHQTGKKENKIKFNTIYCWYGCERQEIISTAKRSINGYITLKQFKSTL